MILRPSLSLYRVSQYLFGEQNLLGLPDEPEGKPCRLIPEEVDAGEWDCGHSCELTRAWKRIQISPRTDGMRCSGCTMDVGGLIPQLVLC